MHARVTSTQTNPEQLDEVLSVIHGSVVPVVQQQPGFAAYLMLGDRGTGKIVAVTLWEAEADREGSGPGSETYNEVMSMVMPLLAADPVVENLEVLVRV